MGSSSSSGEHSNNIVDSITTTTNFTTASSTNTSYTPAELAELELLRLKVAELERDIAELKTENAERKRRIAERKRQRAELEMYMRNVPTAENTYTYALTDRDWKRRREFTMPEIKVNGLVQPHNKKPSMKEQSEKKMKETTNKTKEKEFKSETVCTNAWKDVQDVVIPTRLLRPDDVRVPINSVLGAKAFDHATGQMKVLEYLNERGVQDFVKAQVQDAVNCLGLGSLLTFHVEMSMFSGVLDVVVVSLNGKPLAFIEVKSPERPDKEGEVFKADDVILQMFNYLMGLKKMGHSIPIAILSTYNALVIVTAEDLTKSEKHKKIVSETKQELSVETRKIIGVKSETKPHYKEDKGPSPINKKVALSSRAKNQAGENDKDEKPKALLAALLASYRHNDIKDTEEPPIEEQGDVLGGIFTPKVSSDGMVWTTVRKGVKADYESFPKPSAVYFYLFAHIGHGTYGKVFLASTTSGRMCAMKLYIPERSHTACPDERDVENEENLKVAEAARNKEKERWGALHKKLPFKTKTINDLPALLMVYGRPLEQSDRAARLHEVKGELQRFADAGFAYKDSDLRWRHVVLYNNQILLVALESLEDITELAVEAKNERVETQIAQLAERMDMEKPIKLDQKIY
ncbi:MAG: hypothetical protein SGARI_000582 [Bacillariaceae sp.]